MDIKQIVESQKEYYKTGITHNIEFRLAMLKKLLQEINNFEDEIMLALYQDLKKNKTESYISEISLIKSEIKYMIKYLSRLAKPKKVPTPLIHFIAKSYIYSFPYGVVLIISPWNYPFLLTLVPLIDALAAGNTAILKPSDYSFNSALVIEKIIKKCFVSPYVTTILGGREKNKELLDQKFDYIFFTGSKAVGHLVMQKAANFLTPITLELGGKSPCIVDSTAQIALAAKRIVFGKFLNCGQTCVAPDYLLVHEKIKDILLEKIIQEIENMYTKDPLNNPDYGGIINQKHFNRICNLIDKEKIYYGGTFDESTLKISPTILINVSFNDAIMNEEIFGPLLPIITYSQDEELTSLIEKNSHPLALYIFSKNKKLISFLINYLPFGGATVNDTVIHLASSHLGFGGIGSSGMGSYHGKKGYETFSHFKSVLYKSNLLDISLRYPPYTKNKQKIIKKITK